MRRELLPLAREIFGPSADTAPARLAGLIAGEKVFLEEVARRTLARLADPGSGTGAGPLALAIAPLLELDQALAGISV